MTIPAGTSQVVTLALPEEVRSAIARGDAVRGADADEAARAVIEKVGCGEYFTHRTGHSIDARSLHGSGPNLDNLETRDDRLLVPGVAFSVEPGIYVVPAAGGESKRVSKSGFRPQFDAAGERVLFSGTDENKLLLKSVNLEGHDERTHLRGAFLHELSVSPDGRWFAFTVDWNAYVAPFTLTGKTVDVGPESKAIPVKQVSKQIGRAHV